MDNQTPFYVSSTGTGLSATIGGLSVVGISQGIALLLGFLGHPASQDAITGGLTTLIAAVGSVMAAFGVLRKAFFWLKNLAARRSA